MFKDAFSIICSLRKLGGLLASAFSLAWVPDAHSQTVYVSDSSAVAFFSQTPIELFEAHNSASTAMIEMATQTLRFQVPVAAFQFENKMMQDHFNDGYLEPKKFQYATFRGKLSDSLDLSIDTLYTVVASGLLNVHGIDRFGSYKGVITCKDSIATLATEFNLILAEHEVKVPGAVFDNVAKQVKVKLFFRFRPFRKEE